MLRSFPFSRFPELKSAPSACDLLRHRLLRLQSPPPPISSASDLLRLRLHLRLQLRLLYLSGSGMVTIESQWFSNETHCEQGPGRQIVKKNLILPAKNLKSVEIARQNNFYGLLNLSNYMGKIFRDI